MAQPVWALSVDLQTKTATFQSGLASAARAARIAFTDIKSGASGMGAGVGEATGSARMAVRLLGEEFGVGLPRGIITFVSSLGPVAAAMEAAFPFLAIVVGATLLLEHLAKLRAEGIKLTQDQVNFGTAVQTAFNTLDQKMLSSQIKADELRNDHLGALHLQLKLIDEQSMAELVHSFGEVAKAADVVFADLKTSWYQFGIGSAGAKHALDEFQAKYDQLLAQGRDKEASDLLRGTRESAQKVLDLQKQAAGTSATKGTGSDSAWADELKYRAATTELKKTGVGYTDKEVQAQQTLVDALNAQLTLEGKVAALKNQDKGNASAETGKELAALAAEGQRQAAEHAQKMGELSIQMEREQAEASLSMKQATVAQKLAVDTRLADEEYKVQMAGNAALMAALDKGGKDYTNQLKALQEKAEELTRQHDVTTAGLAAKAQVAQYHEDLQNLEASEREKIEATEQGSAARLAAIDAALKEQQSKNLQETEGYRELLKQRVKAEREYTAESSKLAAEAGKQEAENTLKTGQLALDSQRDLLQLANSLRRESMQEQTAQDIALANAEYTIKKAALEQQEAALDKGVKDYQNKLRDLQNAEKQLVQQHEDEVAAIRAKAQAKQLVDERRAMASMENNFASAFAQVLAGHRSFASMMAGAAQQLTSNLISASIDYANHLDDDKLKQAESAARAGFDWGAKYGGPVAPVLAPAMAATFFAGVMAFQEGTDMVPGIGRGDKVPAMLEPGEGVVPGGVIDGLRNMARSGDMGGGGTHYRVTVHFAPHVQAIDATGVDKMLDKHHDKFQRHFENTLRKMSR